MRLFRRRHAPVKSARNKPTYAWRRRAAAVPFEMLESRLAMTWAGIPPTSITPITPVDATLNGQGDASGAASIASTEVDYYRFTTVIGGSYTFTATTPNSTLDTVVGVFSSTGARLAYNDDYGGSTDSRVQVSLAAGQTYYFGVTNYRTTSRGDYNWSIDGPAGTGAAEDGYEENDTMATAYDLGELTAIKAIDNLVMADAADWFKFTTSAGSTSGNNVQISYLNPQGDLDLELYNSAGALLGRSQASTGTETLSLNGQPAGTYYVRVYGYRGALNPNYSFAVRPPSVPPPMTVDLVGAGFAVTPAANWGDLINISTTVGNAGGGATGAFGVSWYLSSDAVGSANDVLIPLADGSSSYTVPGLGAYGATGFAATLRLPTSAPASLSGTNFYVIMKVDSTGVIAESNENNNFGQRGLGQDFAPIAINTPTQPSSGFQIDLVMTGLTASQQAIFLRAADRWEEVIIGDLPNASYNGVVVDDLLISASAVPIDGVNGVLGQAGPDRFRTDTLLPYHGIMEFDTADIASMEASGLLYSVILHEMGHVLGIGTLWRSKGLIANSGTALPTFTGAQAIAAYNQIFGINSNGVPLEITGGPGTAESHWSDSLFGNELMTGYAGPGTDLPLSAITAGSLADIGYTVNMAAVDPYSPPAINRTRVASRTSTTITQLSWLTAESDLIDVSAAYPVVAAMNATAAPLAQPVLRHALTEAAFSAEEPPLASVVERVIDRLPRRETGGRISLSTTSTPRWTTTAADRVGESWEGIGFDRLWQGV